VFVVGRVRERKAGGQGRMDRTIHPSLHRPSVQPVVSTISIFYTIHPTLPTRRTSAMKRNALLLTNARPTPLAARPKKPVSSEDDVRSAPFLCRRPLVLARKGITSGSSLSSSSAAAAAAACARRFFRPSAAAPAPAPAVRVVVDWGCGVIMCGDVCGGLINYFGCGAAGGDEGGSWNTARLAGACCSLAHLACPGLETAGLDLGRRAACPHEQEQAQQQEAHHP
jgi:hypothetical protein